MATSKLFFEDLEKEIIKKELFTEIAENYVKKFKETKDKKLQEKREVEIKNTPTTTQIRKFFNDVLVLKQKISNSQEEFRKQLPYIKMIKAKVEYSYSRDKVNSAFRDFINRYIDGVQELDDFNVFCDFFEAIIAYSAKYLRK